MNQYGLPLNADVVQALLPVMYESGRMIGYYPITQTTFDGSETEFTLSNSQEVAITTVTIDEDPTKEGRPLQYMACVWSDGTPWNTFPWANELLVSPAEGFYRFFIQPTQTWVLRYQPSNLQVALERGFANVATPPTPPGPPDVTTPATLFWKASVSYSGLLGDCPFFDFNWVTLFAASSDTQAIRIVVTKNPDPVAPATTPPMVAQVIGIPTAVGAGIIRYDTIRIMRMQDTLATGDYEFEFNIYSEDGQVTPAVLTVTVE